MKYNFNNKIINIPDEVIANYVNKLEISEDEAIQMFLDDEGYTENTEVEELTKKAKVNKTDKIVVTDKTKRKQADRKPKEYPEKEKIIGILANALNTELIPELIQITNKSKLIEFTFNGKQYKLDLIEKRQKK